jgi:hypothetical protein
MATSGKRIVADYSKLAPAASGGGGGSSSGRAGAAAAAGGSFVKVHIRLRPPEPSADGELPYSLPEGNKISIKEDKDPFPTEHVFSFHRIFNKDSTQEVRRRRARKRGERTPF